MQQIRIEYTPADGEVNTPFFGTMLKWSFNPPGSAAMHENKVDMYVFDSYPIIQKDVDVSLAKEGGDSMRVSGDAMWMSLFSMLDESTRFEFRIFPQDVDVPNEIDISDVSDLRMHDWVVPSHVMLHHQTTTDIQLRYVGNSPATQNIQVVWYAEKQLSPGELYVQGGSRLFTRQGSRKVHVSFKKSGEATRKFDIMEATASNYLGRNGLPVTITDKLGNTHAIPPYMSRREYIELTSIRRQQVDEEQARRDRISMRSGKSALAPSANTKVTAKQHVDQFKAVADVDFQHPATTRNIFKKHKSLEKRNVPTPRLHIATDHHASLSESKEKTNTRAVHEIMTKKH